MTQTHPRVPPPKPSPPRDRIPPTPPAILPLLAVLVLLLPGCAGPGSLSGTEQFPLEVQNNASRTVGADLELREAYGHTVLFSESYTLPAGERAQANAGRVSYGEYTVRATSGSMSREIDVSFGKDPGVYRFVIYDDIIAFQNPK